MFHTFASHSFSSPVPFSCHFSLLTTSDLGHPLRIVIIINVAKSISIDNLASGAINNSWGWVSSAWDNGLDARLVSSERESHPRSVPHGLVVATLVLVSRNDHNLDVLLSVGVPLVVKIFQVCLEWGAATSPGGGVNYHDQFEAINGLASAVGAVSFLEGVS